MFRILLFVALIAIGATAATWLADRPGDVVVTWQGYRVETSVAVALIGTIVLAAAIALLWTIISTILRLPSIVAMASRQRRRSKGYTAVSRGMVAIGAGDPAAARRFSGEAERLLGKAPLALLLKAQTAQIRGDRSGAESAFKEMLEDDETRVLGLRGLYVEAKRRGDGDGAETYAIEAMRLAPTAGWASEAVFERQCADEDWANARVTLDRRAALRLIGKDDARQGRAALLTAEALAKADREPDTALTLAQEALKLVRDMVPAAALAGRLLARKADLKRAAKTLETAWKTAPHPDLADAYIGLRPGDSTHDRLERARRLAKLRPDSVESRLAVAQAALDAREFTAAREALAPIISDNPTARAFLIAAEIEEIEFGAAGKVREWLARAARAPRDPAWIADGTISDIWRPISPSGRVGAYRWERPAERLAAPAPHLAADEILVDHDEPASARLHDEPPEATLPPPSTPAKVEQRPAVAADTMAKAPVIVETPAATPAPAPAPASDAAKPTELAKPSPVPAAPAPAPAAKASPNAVPAAASSAPPAPIAMPPKPSSSGNGGSAAANQAGQPPSAPLPGPLTGPLALALPPSPDDPGPDGDPLEPARPQPQPRFFRST